MQKYISTSKAAEILGVSRITIFKRIKAKQLKAEKVGRTYIIDPKNLHQTSNRPLTNNAKRELDKALKKVVKEYKQTLILLGKE